MREAESARAADSMQKAVSALETERMQEAERVREKNTGGPDTFLEAAGGNGKAPGRTERESRRMTNGETGGAKESGADSFLPEVRVRPMNLADLEAVSELERLSFSVPWSRGLLAGCLESRFYSVWVLEISDPALPAGEAAGYCNLRVIAGEGELMRIAVHPRFRGRGLAGKLMDVLVSSAREQGAETLSLEVRSSNAAAISLYKSFGFTQAAVRKGYYACPAEDALIMVLFLA